MGNLEQFCNFKNWPFSARRPLEPLSILTKLRISPVLERTGTTEYIIILLLHLLISLLQSYFYIIMSFITISFAPFIPLHASVASPATWSALLFHVNFAITPRLITNIIISVVVIMGVMVIVCYAKINTFYASIEWLVDNGMAIERYHYV